jgi:hypothetical protein
MTDAAVETKKTRNRRPKGQSMPVMKELLGLMDERTKIMGQIRSKRMEIGSKQAELAQLEASMQALATEIQWRANIFGMTSNPADASATPAAYQPFTPAAPFPPHHGPMELTQPIFAPASAQPNAPQRNFNRGDASSALAGIS